MDKNTDPRHEARKLALGTLFCWLFADSSEDACFNLAGDLLREDAEANVEMANEIVAGVKEHKEEIDKKIEAAAPDWPVEKISKVDLIILRIALFEILYKKHVPKKVSVDEAIELAKQFGNETSSKFVNGVLGSIIEGKKLEEN